MEEIYSEMDCPLADIVGGLSDIEDRGEPCDREIAEDGTQIILRSHIDDEPQQV